MVMADETTDTGLPEGDFDLAFEAAAAGDETSPVEETTTSEKVVAPVEEQEAASADVETTTEKPTGVEDTEKVETASEESEKVATDDTSIKEPDPESVVEAATKAAVVATAAIEKAKADEQATATATAQAQADAKKLADDAVARETPSEEELATIAQMETDFPEVAKAFEIQQRVLLAKIENLLSSKVGDVTTQFDQHVATTAQALAPVAQSTHEGAILAAHPDVFEIIKNVEEWVTKQPSLLQKTYDTVLDKGTTKDVIELVQTYKDATGVKAAPTAEELAQQAADAEKAEDKEKKLKAQEGVRGRRTESQTAIDPDDFEGAFNKYAEA